VKNEIESFVFDAQDRLEQREYRLCSTEDERIAISAKLSEASDWLIEQEDSTPRKVVVVICAVRLKLKKLLNLPIMPFTDRIYYLQAFSAWILFSY